MLVLVGRRYFRFANLTHIYWLYANYSILTASSGRRLFAPLPPPTPTVHSNNKLNMAGRINDHELIPLARNNRTPALQAKQCFKWPFSLKPIGACTYGKILHKFNNFLASREHKLKIKFNNDLKAFNANYITAIQANKFI